MIKRLKHKLDSYLKEVFSVPSVLTFNEVLNQKPNQPLYAINSTPANNRSIVTIPLYFTYSVDPNRSYPYPSEFTTVLFSEEGLPVEFPIGPNLTRESILASKAVQKAVDLGYITFVNRAYYKLHLKPTIAKETWIEAPDYIIKAVLKASSPDDSFNNCLTYQDNNGKVKSLVVKKDADDKWICEKESLAGAERYFKRLKDLGVFVSVDYLPKSPVAATENS